MKIRILLSALILACNFSAMGAVHKLYVSPSGDDANDGSSARPLASLQGAVTRAAAMQDDPSVDGFSVKVSAGVYTQYEPLVIDASLSKPIEFRGEDQSFGKSSIISGGMLSGRFTAVNDRLWKAYIPEVARYGFRFEQIYINGERRFRAQNPNRGEFAAVKELQQLPVDSTNLGRDIYGWSVLRVAADRAFPFGSKCRTFYISGEGSPDVGGMEAMGPPVLTFYHKWDVTRRPLLHVDSDGVMCVAGRGMMPWNQIDGLSRMVAENDINFLDAEGEWILCSDGWLYYIPYQGEEIEEVTCHIPVADRFVILKGESADKPVSDVTFSNIRFEHASYLTPDEGNNPMQAAAGIGAVVEADYARNVRFYDCTIAHTGLGGVWFRRGCSDCSLERCHIYDVGASGVKIGETIIRENEEDITHNIKIDNNIIQHGGFIFPCAVGVIIFHAHDNQVTHNDIADFRYTGVSVGWRWGYDYSPSKRNMIEYNHIHHLGWAQLSDMGGVYTLGPSEGTSVSNNVLHHIYSLYYGGWGLYTDEGSSYIRLENNLVYKCKTGGFHQHYGKENIVRNNIFAGQIRTQLEASRVEPHLSFEFSHNIVYYTDGELCGVNWANVGHKSNYNCYYRATEQEQMNWQGLSFEQWQAKGQDTDSVIADPQFADINAGDFTPKNKKMLTQIGFSIFDYTKAGVYGSKQWRQKAELSEELKAAFDKLVDDYE